MGDLKWITQTEFEMYLRVEEFIRKNGYDEFNLRKFEVKYLFTSLQ